MDAADDARPAQRRRSWRSLSVQAVIALCLLGVGGSIYAFYDSFSRYYVQRENLVFVSTGAEVELARYSTALLRVAASGGQSPQAMADAEFRFDIFLSRLDLYRAGSIYRSLMDHQDGRAILARIETIEQATDPRSIRDWGPASVQDLERRIAAASQILREVSLILLRRETADERRLIALLRSTVFASLGFFAIGATGLWVFLRARAKALRAAERARAAAEAADRAKSDFLATMSHEIRTPLNAVIGLSNLLDNTDLTPRQRHLVQTMEAAGGQLLEIVNDVLDVSRLQAGRVTLADGPVHVRSFVERLVLIINGLPNAARLQIASRVAPDVPARVLGDDSRLMQILTNLMGNAVKFTASGRVDLEVSAEGMDGGAPRLVFVVADTGPGVPEELRGEIFEPFAQGRAERLRPHAGSGLGLSISRGLARLMGGDVVLLRSTGRGARFALQVPLREAPAETTNARNPGTSTGARALEVLVAEDTPTNQLVVRLMLEGLGHHVRIVGNGLEAVEAFGSGNFDLVFLDIQMPVMDGFEAARRIRQMGGRGADVPVVALSAFTQSSDREQALAAGMSGFLPKPIRQRELAAAIAGAVAPVDRDRRDPQPG